MKTIELKHLAPYLPYKVKGKSKNTGTVFTITGFNDRNSITTYGDLGMSDFEGTQLLLRPLSYLTKEIDFNGEKFVPIKSFGYDDEYKITFYPNFRYFYVYRDGIHVICNQGEMIDKLYEWHFDVFGLIEKGLAISIHDLIK